MSATAAVTNTAAPTADSTAGSGVSIVQPSKAPSTTSYVNFTLCSYRLTFLTSISPLLRPPRVVLSNPLFQGQVRIPCPQAR